MRDQGAVEPELCDERDPHRWRLAIRVAAMPADTNGYGDVFGGWLMSQADIAGASVAIQAATGRVATVAVKEFRFLAPVSVGDLVDIYARVHRIGNTSVTVEVRAWARGEADPDVPRPVSTAFITYVAMDGRGRPRPIDEAGG